MHCVSGRKHCNRTRLLQTPVVTAVALAIDLGGSGSAPKGRASFAQTMKRQGITGCPYERPSVYAARGSVSIWEWAHNRLGHREHRGILQ
eukprot:583624-Pyramimonas_sp.AAC.1